MRLKSFDVCGFRSLVNVVKLPIGGPTILAGQNDGGKTAVIDALRYFLGDYKLADEDRSYLLGSTDSCGERCDLTQVHGFFELDQWEQRTFGRPAAVEVRRCSQAGDPAVLEILTDVHEDEELWDLSDAKKLPELQELARKYDVRPEGTLKAQVLKALQQYASANATKRAWLPVPHALAARLPESLTFDGQADQPDNAVKTALTSRFTEYVTDPDLRGRITDLEIEVQCLLRKDADKLCRHIAERCSDLGEISVEPKVSFREGFVGAPLHIERSSGQPVKLDRSGLGSRRRISLAVWEWMSKLLKEDEEGKQPAAACGGSATAESGEDEVDEPPLRQKIVIYDEPDTHLDYRQQRKVMQLIREQSELAHVNVVVATHSMNLIDGVDIADVINLRIESERTVVERLVDDSHEHIDGHLGNIAASLGLRNSVLLHERVFLAVEGDSEYQAFPLLFRLSEGLSLQSAGIALWACGGNDGALSLAKYLVRRGRDVVLAVDADSRTKKMFRDGRLSDVFGAAWRDKVEYIGSAESCDELEATFSDEVWARVANSRWTRSDDRKWEEADFSALRDGSKFSTSVDRMLSEFAEGFQSGKSSTMAELADALTDPADIPQSLKTLFTRLRELAN